MAEQEQAEPPRPEGSSSPPVSPDGKPDGDKDKGKRVRKRVRVRGDKGAGSSSPSSRSGRRKKSKGSSGITYSIGNDSPISGGYRLWLTGGLILLSVVVMAYLVLTRLGGPPPIPSD